VDNMAGNLKKYYMGIDIGSLSTDGVLINGDFRIVKSIILPTGASIIKTISTCREELLHLPDKKDVRVEKTISTGYGRKRVEFADEILTEITAHALGALHSFPKTRTVVDIGGQDTKVIRIGDKGRILDFAMNDKCAAGTGRFLEVMARILETDLDEMTNIAVNANEAADITSTCTVFIESEIISLISESVEIGAIAAGVFKSIAGRILGMIRGIGGKPPLTLTGGVAKNRAMVHFMKDVFQGEVNVPKDPQITGSLGAAIFGLRKNWTDA